MLPDRYRNIARIENDLVLNYQYVFSAREQKTMLSLIANLETGSDSVTISTKDIENILKDDDKKWGNAYNQITDLYKSLLGKKFYHKTNVSYKGSRLDAGYNWFQSIVPIEENGRTLIRFRFSQDTLPFLLKLKEYVQINTLEVKHMKSAFSLRFFQLLKARRNRTKEHADYTEFSYTVEELKALFGLENKYPRFNNFRQKVLDVALSEINGKTSIFFKLAFQYQKSREKKIESIHFKVFDSEMDALAHERQLQLDFEAKNKKLAQKGFSIEVFKKAYPKIYKIAKKKAIQEMAIIKTQCNLPIPNLDDMTNNHIKGYCKLYFDCKIAQTNKFPEVMAELKRVFETAI
ncbi:MAG: replication initiation protein [Saprospiraceae bacterium]|nr:replication initiation protein [Saprospiraceae bacterium]